MQEMQETQVRSLDKEDLREKELATQSIILAWKIPWADKACLSQPQWSLSAHGPHEGSYSHNYWAFILEPASCNYWTLCPRACALKQEKPLQWEACKPQWRVALLAATRESPCSKKTQLSQKQVNKKDIKEENIWGKSYTELAKNIILIFPQTGMNFLDNPIQGDQMPKPGSLCMMQETERGSYGSGGEGGCWKQGCGEGCPENTWALRPVQQRCSIRMFLHKYNSFTHKPMSPSLIHVKYFVIQENNIQENTWEIKE